jgi:hypothetical protein
MDFIIDKAVPAPEDNPRNVFRLHVVGMSGDADHYETNTRDYDNLPAMMPVFRMMCRGFQTARLYDNKALEIAIEMEGERLDDGNPDYKPYAQDLYSELVGYDITNGGVTKCMPDKMYVRYFNEFGIEHEIQMVLDNGDLVKEVTEYTDFDS